LRGKRLKNGPVLMGERTVWNSIRVRKGKVSNQKDLEEGTGEMGFFWEASP